MPNGRGTLYNDDGSVCKEGEWDNGYIHEDNGYYDYKTESYLNGGYVKLIILTNFIIIKKDRRCVNWFFKNLITNYQG